MTSCIEMKLNPMAKTIKESQKLKTISGKTVFSRNGPIKTLGTFEKELNSAQNSQLTNKKKENKVNKIKFVSVDESLTE